MSELLQAIALILVLEGLLYAAFPLMMLRAIDYVRQLPISSLRLAGVISAVVGVFFLYVIRSF